MTQPNQKIQLIAAIQSYDVPEELLDMDGVIYDATQVKYVIRKQWLIEQPYRMLTTVLTYLRDQHDLANSRDEQPVPSGDSAQPGDGGARDTGGD